MAQNGGGVGHPRTGKPFGKAKIVVLFFSLLSYITQRAYCTDWLRLFRHLGEKAGFATTPRPERFL